MGIDDYINEFASDEYVKSNIRVRPVSGLSKIDEQSDARGMTSRNVDGESENEDHKYNVDVQHDLNDMRSRIRDQHHKRQELKELAEAKAEENNGKKK